ncbi:hypothetical protein SRHO_G00008680 [Serrasalmus rhombeus]
MWPRSLRLLRPKPASCGSIIPECPLAELVPPPSKLADLLRPASVVFWGGRLTDSTAVSWEGFEVAAFWEHAHTHSNLSSKRMEKRALWGNSKLLRILIWSYCIPPSSSHFVLCWTSGCQSAAENAWHPAQHTPALSGVSDPVEERT